jgi:hypothetical protein
MKEFKISLLGGRIAVFFHLLAAVHGRSGSDKQASSCLSALLTRNAELEACAAPLHNTRSCFSLWFSRHDKACTPKPYHYLGY